MRDEKFKEAKELFNKSGAILLNWATGLGKTLASLRLLGEDNRIVVLCQELSHIKNWKEELKKHGLELNIEFYTYASMHKVEGENYDLILDESHWCMSDLRQERLAKLNYNRIVLLSASMEPMDIGTMIQVIPGLKIHTVDMQEAIDGGVLPDPEINVLELELDTITKQYLHYAKRGVNGPVFTCTYGTFFKTLKKAREHKNYYVVCACTEKQKYDLLKGEADSIKRKAFHNERLWNVYKHKILEIKRFLASIKTNRVEAVMEMLRSQGERFIVFGSSIDQAKQLSDISIHSENSEKVNQSILEDFNNQVTDEIVTVKMLRESINLTDIDSGVIVQIDNKKRSPVQMIGRILRGKNPKIYIMAFVNTIDDDYIRNHLKEIRHVRLQTKFII